jgi:hypothetical protein
MRWSQQFFYSVPQTGHTFGFHGGLQRRRTSDTAPWKTYGIIDFEWHPEPVTLADKGPVLTTRLRCEIFWRQGAFADRRHTLRGNAALTWDGPTDWLDAILVRNEFFYNLDHGRLVGNRFYPVWLRLDLDSLRFSPSIYLLINSQRPLAGGGWREVYVLGLDFVF